MKTNLLYLKLEALHKKFDSEFTNQWNIFLKECNETMSRAKQLNIGSHTRPFLVYLGYLTNNDFDAQHNIKEVAKLAVSIEAIHKASVIVDDIIDGDILRHGKPCMHKEFGEYETIFFALCMLAKGIENVNQLLLTEKNASIHAHVISLLCDTIFSMCSGVIQEITATVPEQLNLTNIQKIINSETVKLIENSLYIGFMFSKPEISKIEKNISNIGKKCGYIFQVMNDLEAFCNPEYIFKYKGNLNVDFFRSRKNIVLPYLYNACNRTDKTLLTRLPSDTTSSFDIIKNLFDKYQIKNIIIKDIDDIYQSIFTALEEISTQVTNEQWISVFSIYLKYIKNKYQSILNI